MSVPAQPCPDDEDPVHVEAFNAVAIASVAWQEQTSTLSYYLALAHSHGLTVPEICRASGLDQPFVTRLLEGAAL